MRRGSRLSGAQTVITKERRGEYSSMRPKMGGSGYCFVLLGVVFDVEPLKEVGRDRFIFLGYGWLLLSPCGIRRL